MEAAKAVGDGTAAEEAVAFAVAEAKGGRWSELGAQTSGTVGNDGARGGNGDSEKREEFKVWVRFNFWVS